MEAILHFGRWLLWGEAAFSLDGWALRPTALITLGLSVLIIFFERKAPKTVWAWLLVIYFMPVIGFILYSLIGLNSNKENMFHIKEVADILYRRLPRQREENACDAPPPGRYEGLIAYNRRVSGSIYTDRNRVEIITDGEDKFRRLLEAIDNAETYIHLQYYIIKYDELYEEISRHLERKAAEGVEVRILYDSLGSKKMPARIWKREKQKGIQIGVFFPAFFRWLHLRINYRNHRKIAVIDGKTGFVGGFNIGREYISRSKRFGYWRDTHLQLRGSAVMALQIRFALDWNYATEENLFREARYFIDEPCAPEAGKRAGSGIQIISSGPDASCQQIRDNYLMLIHEAKRELYIQTPYFIPDEAILAALLCAARSGVRIYLMLPGIADHWFVYRASLSYVEDILKAGGRCFCYRKGFLHAKGIVVDEEIYCYGTANLDIRSFALNFEVNAVVYDWESAREMSRIFKRDLEECEELTLEAYMKRPFYVRALEGVARLFSPLF